MPVSGDQSNFGAIKPNHFLLGKQTIEIPSVIAVENFDNIKRYATPHSYANAIWFPWSKEYENRRSRWQTPAEQHLKTGGLV